MNKLIGIISYLPDDAKVHKARFDNLGWLLEDCYRFNLPILIVAQNWTPEEVASMPDNVIVKEYPKLGIVGARNTLRELFLELNYDYLIMLDDDCDIRATDEGIKAYLREIDDNPDCAIEFRYTLLKLYAISKKIFKEIKFREDITAEAGIGFEDTIFVNEVRNKFPDRVKSFRCRYHGINEVSVNAGDTLSTWYTNQNLEKMLETTHKIVDEMKIEEDPMLNLMK